jgi:dihydroxyacetone kinase-like protein
MGDVMSNAVTNEHIIAWIKKTAEVIEQKREYLTELDTAIGDADHGNNMHRGYQHAVTQLSADQQDIGAILKNIAMTLMSKVGGAGGPLYGTMFLQASSIAKGKTELNSEDMKQFFIAAVEGVQKRGKAVRGEKTMLDSLIPAKEAFQAATEDGKPLADSLSAAVSAAEEGMNGTIDMIATKGRASYLGERSRGHMDPGAASSYLILKALYDVYTGS